MRVAAMTANTQTSTETRREMATEMIALEEKRLGLDTPFMVLPSTIFLILCSLNSVVRSIWSVIMALVKFETSFWKDFLPLYY